jgi:hypothetical protein
MNRSSSPLSRRATGSVLALALALAGNLSVSAGERPSEQAGALLLDEVVAVVDREVITRSQLVQEAWLVRVDRRGQAGLEDEPTPAFLRKVLDLLINQQVLLSEARRQGLPQVSEAERDDLLTGFRRRFADQVGFDSFLRQNGLDQAMVSEVLARHLRVERLKESRLRLFAEVTDEQVAGYYAQHQASFGGASLAAVAEAIRHRLGSARSERELARWIWELRKRSEIKLLVDFDGGARAQEAEGGDDDGM